MSTESEYSIFDWERLISGKKLVVHTQTLDFLLSDC